MSDSVLLLSSLLYSRVVKYHFFLLFLLVSGASGAIIPR